MKTVKRQTPRAKAARAGKSRAARETPCGLKESVDTDIEHSSGSSIWGETHMAYRPADEIDRFVDRVAHATLRELNDIERQGVAGSFVRELAARIGISSDRLAAIIGSSSALDQSGTTEDARITGSEGRAVIGLARLLAKVQEIVSCSTSSHAHSFDAATWLGQWIERPQPALGGRRPSDLIGTHAGVGTVSRLLGSAVSGAPQ